jgi:hypothetical protein
VAATCRAAMSVPSSTIAIHSTTGTNLSTLTIWCCFLLLPAGRHAGAVGLTGAVGRGRCAHSSTHPYLYTRLQWVSAGLVL